jgi:hypothetical protein
MLRNALLNKHRKGELTFTQIIIAVISIIVLIVVIMIFSGGLRNPTRTLTSCSLNNNGQCIDNQTKCNGIILRGNYSDCNSLQQYCCVNPLSR